MANENFNWQPISFMPQIAEMIDGMLDAAKETIEGLLQIKVHDDFTIKRIFEVTGSQVEDEGLYDKQLNRWLKIHTLENKQREEIQRLQSQMAELKQENRKILAIAEEGSVATDNSYHKNTNCHKNNQHKIRLLHSHDSCKFLPTLVR